MSFEIRINGTPFALWKSATVQRSIDSNAGAFRFSNSTQSPIGSYPVKTGDFVEILVRGVRKIAGFVDEISGSQSGASHTIDVSGRDNTQDLIDSSVPDAAKVTEGPIALWQLAAGVISAIGAEIGVVTSIGNASIDPFSSDDLQAAGTGETCMAYLVSFARKRQVYLVPDGSGNLVVYRPDSGNRATDSIIHKPGEQNNNVVSYSFRQSLQDRFRTYNCKSQDNVGVDPLAEYYGEGTDRKGSASDGQIRETRYHEFQAEQTMKGQTCAQRAAEESNLRRAMGTTYTVSVPGAAQSDGTLWDFGQFVYVDDSYAGITGTYLIKTVEYAIDTTGGTRTQLTMVPPDAYQVTAEPTKENARSASTGKGYANQTPKSQGMIR